MKMTMTTWIACAPEVAFARFADLPNLAGRVSGITKVEMLTPGPVAVGTKYKETRTMFGRDATEEFTVTALEPGKVLTLTCHSCGVRYTATHTFTPEANGTRVTLTMDGKTTTFSAWLFQPLGWLMKGTMQKMIQKDLDEMKLA
jgi:carbon monoxide dehydrogenase subunit G